MPTDSLDSNIARSNNAVIGGIQTAVVPDRKAPDNELGKDAFLKLLVAQMKYQDPMNPSDGTEFIAQTAQFTLVEKMAAMAEQNDKMLANQQQLTASTFIGRDVAWTAKDDSGKEVKHSGTVTGISFTKDGPTLRVGTEDIPLSQIEAVAPVIDNPSDGTNDTNSSTDGDSNSGSDAANQTDPN
jgi:flagellar basal-body rod modification protein FlgD